MILFEDFSITIMDFILIFYNNYSEISLRQKYINLFIFIFKNYYFIKSFLKLIYYLTFYIDFFKSIIVKKIVRLNDTTLNLNIYKRLLFHN